jgi:hypothetical protein
MFLTNPASEAYEQYAVAQVVDRLAHECQQLPLGGFETVIEAPCRGTLDAAKPSIKEVVTKSTTRQNLGLFSIYRSDISVPELNFNARVESIGAFDRFFTYKAP